MEVYWDSNEAMASNLCVWRKRVQWYGITPGHRQCSFVSGITIGATVTSSIETLIQVERNVMNLSVLRFDNVVLENYYLRIVEFSPDWIYTTPSAIMVFIDFCKRNGYEKPKSVKYIELYGELVSSAAYNTISDFFGVPCAVMYGAKEVNTIALMCPHGHLHVLTDNVYVEIHQGELLLTSLKNTVFPIIRYAIGDNVELESVNCSCGGAELCIKNIFGRAPQINYLKDTNGLTTKVLGNAVFIANERLGAPILQYQVVIHKTDVELVLSVKSSFKTWKNAIINEIYDCLMDYNIGKDKIKIQIQESLLEINPNTAKLPQFIVKEN